MNEREQSLSAADLDKRVAKARKDLEKAIELVPGGRSFLAEILEAFVSKHVSGASYETFRNLVLDKMTLDQDRRPSGMTEEILGQIEMADTKAA